MVTMTVDGKISGTRSVNNGQRSSFEVLADVFRVISSGLQGFEVMDGYQRNYSQGAQLIFGHSFGAQNDLVLWYGQNIGAAACTKANAVIWFDKSGNAYFGGMVAQGVLRYFNSSTQLGLITVQTEMVSSNIKPVAVTARFQYDGFQGFYGQANFGPAQSTTYAIVAIDRQYQGGGWAEIARRTLPGSARAQPGIDGDGNNTWSISGDLLVTDTASSTPRIYRTRVINIQLSAFAFSGSGGPSGPMNINQYQSIESME